MPLLSRRRLDRLEEIALEGEDPNDEIKWEWCLH